MTSGIISPRSGFWRKSTSEKVQALRYRFKTGVWNKLCSRVPLPTRLPDGMWWLAWNDALSDGAFARILDGPEIKFLEGFLRHGMTTIDVGAHLGFHTLLMSRKVGTDGHVVAFEPSPREFRHLKMHIAINRCTNVQPERLAVADRSGPRELFIAGPPWTTRNSLRAPKLEGVQAVITEAVTLDEYLSAEAVKDIDLIKLDAEGAELGILHGAVGLLSRVRRPVVLCEINDPVIAECGWGHRGQHVLDFLQSKGFTWYGLRKDGNPARLEKSTSYYADLVAVPEERINEVAVPRGDE